MLILINLKCKYCNKDHKVIPSRAKRTPFCSKECSQKYKFENKEKRKRKCIICEKIFYPRTTQIKEGNGKLCSIKCRNEYALPFLISKESKAKSKIKYKENLIKGLIKHPKGKDHPKWLGGPKEMIKRRIASGKANESVKKYRAKNPEKTREWSQTRVIGKTGKLPNGTIKSKLLIQNYLCNICGTSVKEKYHMDHIIPLSKGGLHNPENIQILCPHCNMTKFTKI